MSPHATNTDAVNGASSSSAAPAPAAAGPKLTVKSDKSRVDGQGNILTDYLYENSVVKKQADGSVEIIPTQHKVQFKTQTKVPKTGLMMVGLGGNNGSTMTAVVHANRRKVEFQTRRGAYQSNYYGSVTQAATVKLGIDEQGDDFYVPFNQVLPMVNPNDLVIGGWDISNLNLAEAMQRAQVLEYDLQRQVSKELAAYTPLPSVYYPDFIAANQGERANNVIPGDDKWAHVEHLRKDMREFKEKHGLEQLIVMWTANTERYAEIIPGVNDTADNLLKSIKASHAEIAPSTIFAVACILDGTPFVNGSPQNTFVPGCLELAERHKSFVGGDDFKSGQTKLKSVLAQFLVDAGIRPVSIASYNHLGNNDGLNLSAPQQFRSKEISKASVVDDIIASNQLLYNEEKGKTIDHTIVIKYLKAVGDTKIAMDSYESEILMGGRNTITVNTVCEDSLLATPLIIDLVVVAELFSRVQYKSEGDAEWQNFHAILTVLSYWLKAPLHKPEREAINGLNKQRQALENLMRAFIGLPPNNEMRLESIATI
ncbi:myo-inositol-1-phosphate synthase [Protomyces lactucae-debilis]|uniref:Inositol-3-phosphate synthase n=1 Tax=Protomyces lactucae-debilis TaxID=2754530 RepID=A0A1Y2EPZ4_PROLT|nr:myo-inositol-1-phosphate synthase [Protomyces lactucae-debilis]ORY73660.1 myo-inositol-1-phosphate synthase [Protomyces lactucae-debilis]